MFEILAYSKYPCEEEWGVDEILDDADTIEDAREKLKKQYDFYVRTGNYDVEEIYNDEFFCDDYQKGMPDKKIAISKKDVLWLLFMKEKEKLFIG